MAHHLHRAVSFREVLAGTFSLIVRKRRTLSIALVCFTMLSAVLAAGLERRIGTIEDAITFRSGLQWEELQDTVDRRLQAFTPADVQQLLTLLRNRNNVEAESTTLTSDEASLQFIAQVGPQILLSFAVNLFIFFVACVFFLLLAGSTKESGYDVFWKLPLKFLQMIGLLLWLSVRSLGWIPLVGPLVALYMLPRLVLSPVLYVNEQEGMFESVHRSMKMTSGRWFSVFLQLLCIFLFTVAFLWLGVVIVIMITLFSAKIGFLIWLLTLFGAAALQMFFVTALTVLLD